MKKNILVLAFTVSFIFLCTPQLFAEEDNNTFWVDFFGLPSSDDSAKDAVKNDPLLDMKTDSEIENPAVDEESLIQPEFSDPEVLKKNIVEAPPCKAS